MASPMPNLGAILKPLADAIKGLTASVTTSAVKITDASKSIGSAFAQVGAIVAPAASLVVTAGQAVGGAFVQAGAAIGSAVAGIARAADSLTGGRLSAAVTAVSGFVVNVVSVFKDLGSKVLDAVGPPLAAAYATVRDVFGKVKDAVLSIAAIPVKLTAAIASAVGATSQFTGAVAGMLKGMADAGANALRKPFQVLDTLIGSMSQGITRFVALYDPGRVAVFQYAVDSLYAAIGQALAPAMDAVTQIIRSISSAIAGAGERGKMLISALALGTIGMIAFAAAMAALQAVMSGGILPIIAGLVGAIGGFALASGMLKPLLDKLAPIISGVMNVLGEALERVTAVVQGPLVSGLQKFVEFGSKFVSYLAGAFERMGPAIGTVFEIIDAIRPAFEAIFGTVYGNFVEVIVLVAQEFQKLAPQIIAVTTIISDWVVGLMALVREIINSLGLYTIPDFEKMATPKGGAKNAPPPVRGTSTTDVESVIRKARESAFSLGGGGSGGEKPEVKTAAATSQTAQSVADLKAQFHAFVQGLPHYVFQGGQAALNWFWGLLLARIDQIKFPGQDLARQAEEVVRGERDVRDVKVPTPFGDVSANDIYNRLTRLSEESFRFRI